MDQELQPLAATQRSLPTDLFTPILLLFYDVGELKEVCAVSPCFLVGVRSGRMKDVGCVFVVTATGRIVTL